jgi:hypothetical protein
MPARSEASFKRKKNQEEAEGQMTPNRFEGRFSVAAEKMGYGLRRNKIEGGSGGKRGHSNITHWEYTEEIKQRSRKARRQAAKLVGREAKHGWESPGAVDS